jgi:hypothetical protein
VDEPSNAFAAGADEEDRQQYSDSSTTNSELIQDPRTGLGRNR